MNRIMIKRWGVVIFYLLVVIFNYLSQTIPLNGQTNGAVSHKYDTMITPAGYAFAIWGLIYLLQGLYAWHQVRKSSQTIELYDKLAPLLMINFLANCLWLVVFQYELIPFSVIVMLVILATLIRMQMLIARESKLPLKEKNFIRVPFDVYLGWISVATIVNISVWLKYTNWPLWGIGEAEWVIIMAVIGTLVAYYLLKKTNAMALPLVFVWAYFAIMTKNGEHPTIVPAMLALVVFLLITTVKEIFRVARSSSSA